MTDIKTFIETHLPRYVTDPTTRSHISDMIQGGIGSVSRTLFDLGSLWERVRGQKIEIGERDLHRLIDERDFLIRQRDDLHERMSDMVNNSLYRQVRAFHLRFGHPVRTVPTVPSDDEMRFRLKLITEEYRELLAACGIGDAELDVPSGYGTGSLNPFEDIKAAIDHCAMRVNFPELMDACGDLDFVVEGTRAVAGCDGRPIANEIARANLEKDPVYVKAKDNYHDEPDPLAKPTKPAGWRPPDIEGVLVKQGWGGAR